MLTESEKQKRVEFIAGLREVLSLYERVDDLPAPFGVHTFCVFADDIENFIQLRRLIGCSQKNASKEDGCFDLVRELPGEIVLHLMLFKSKTCTRVEVGKRVVPAQPAKPERVETVYEWACPPSLLELAAGVPKESE